MWDRVVGDDLPADYDHGPGQDRGDGVRSTEPRDPDPHANPATRGELPDETTESEDTDTEATKGNPEVAPEDEAPA